MFLISQTERKSLRFYLISSFFYAILILGAFAMIYPLAMMLSLSITNRMDYSLFRLKPLLFGGEAERFVHFIGERYQNADWVYFISAYRKTRVGHWTDIAENPEKFS